MKNPAAVSGGLIIRREHQKRDLCPQYKFLICFYSK
jgi:hypothetical protein